MKSMENKKQFFLEAYKLEIIKFGRFTLKSGIESPFYVDLRPLASDPHILKHLAAHMLYLTPSEGVDLLCGVPYAALPVATAMSLQSGTPLIIKRKEAKAYGTKKLIEGIYKKGQNCLLVEDVITSGKSLLETIAEVEREGLLVKDIVVILDREQGGKQLLEAQGYRVHALFTISEAVSILEEAQKISAEDAQRIADFLKGSTIKFEQPKRLSYEEKLAAAEHPAAQKLLSIALEKKTNLIASADVMSTEELLRLADSVGPYIAALKTHIDILRDFHQDKTVLPLIDLAKKHNFLLLEDRKFADIGNTQELQFTEGLYKISNWADMVTSHVIAGAQSLDCFRNVGVVVIAGMSSKGALTDANYHEEAVKIAQEHPSVIGCVSQTKIPEQLLLFTPGVNADDEGDSKGQQYNTPEHVFSTLHTDFMIVGRGIYRAEDPEKAALAYKNRGWEAYLETL